MLTISCNRSRVIGTQLWKSWRRKFAGLQRSEIHEVEEGFAKGGQKGSSAMPHKRNPIGS